MQPLSKTLLSVMLLCSMCLPRHGHSTESTTVVELGLEDFIKLAVQNNPGVTGARNQVLAAEGRSTQAVSAYLPQLNATGTTARVHINDLTPIDEDTVLSGSVSASQLIFDFGKTTGSISASNYDVEAARAYLNSVGSDLIFAVKAAYYNVLAQYYLIDVANEQVKSYQMHYDRAKEYYKAGVKSKIDVTNAEVELTNSSLQLLQSQFALKSAKVTLEKIVGTVPGNGHYTIKMNDHNLQDFINLLADLPSSLSDLLDKASRQRPDLLQAQQRVHAAESSVTVASSSYWPQVGANGSYNTYDTDLPTLADEWQVSVGLDWDFFSGFRTNGEVAEAKSNLRSSQAQLRDIELTSIQEVTDSFLLSQEKRESVSLADKILKLAQENLDLADERYKTGLGDMIEFNDAQLRLTAARSNLVTTYFDYNTALAKLENAIGLYPDMSEAEETLTRE